MVAAATQTLKVLQPAEPCFSVRGSACSSVSQATLDAQLYTGGASHSGRPAFGTSKGSRLGGWVGLGIVLDQPAWPLSVGDPEGVCGPTHC